MKFTQSNKLRKRAHALIPGGAHTYSKGDDQFPKLSPGFIVKGKGAYVWDADGNKFLDWAMGLRSTTLGHGYVSVVQAVKKQLPFGANFSRPSILEVELADLLTKIIPCAEMVKFAKNGSTITTAAVKLARAHTKRDIVAVCSDHAFFSYDDWFIGTTPADAGVPQAIKDLSVTFKFNDLESVRALFKKYPKQIACVILEPATEVEPRDNFLHGVQALCQENGAVFILDEMISGFRWHLKGAQHTYKITPDLATYGKGIANGFSVCVLAGKREIMERGGIQGGHERVFLISTTHGAENHALAAAIATIKEIQGKKVIPHLYHIGALLQTRLNAIAKKYKLGEIVNVFGEVSCRLATTFAAVGTYTNFQVKTYFLQELISQGILFNGYFAPSYSHGKREIEKTVLAWDYACRKLQQAVTNKDLEKKLIGDPVKPVFRKYN
ncbi:MAG: glutamate-1-semialdehyde 2,1-aminomutase [Candidatus Yanofskybacteria bacterium RIFCSPLOWO2_02_FULL_45_10]|uniref:Glutamate-1-semialdehyde 2,1-aminomutase n=2 Tax=Candidatus Yanofskyibacteriota TaxID=1752733 RepID=A0A1F8G432_9BACT|nr:MAG: glutamate-1-semialdehyde 2,1-aminomutase [Candidatus Yanofskybacteria bacterium RIFCSPHIGHO2_12_FULL_45_19b]OGN32481.1 MAG: glutamate-1-semialdehyde 2,1-aminomutase [Candidatus Yanofskybacteria bacterium RIFCSPLOWO2_02_FULL_45_10]